VHDRYLAKLSADKRTALEKLRSQIKAAAPQAEECMSYGIPGFRLNGKLLVSYGATKNHLAFYPGSVVREFKSELKNFETGTGTIRFSPDNPIPATVVRKIVKTRIKQQNS